MRGKLGKATVLPQDKGNALHSVSAGQEVGREDFIYWSFENQYYRLTEVQKDVVDDDVLKSPLRIDGAAGTGKTMSMIMRAYRLLETHKKCGLPCSTKKDKELIFPLFIAYQNELKAEGSFDVGGVVMEALARLNAPIWRRERAVSGYDYIFVDEMHLFNINEQSVFYFLTKNLYQLEIPICFALDYSQAVGDRGNVSADYIECGFGKATKKKYHTVFRNSPQITDFCTSIATSGVLMFHEQFSDPYHDTHSDFLLEDEAKSRVPSLYEYDSNEEMPASLDQHLQNIVRDLRCNPRGITVIAFDSKFYSEQDRA